MPISLCFLSQQYPNSLVFDGRVSTNSFIGILIIEFLGKNGDFRREPGFLGVHRSQAEEARRTGSGRSERGPGASATWHRRAAVYLL